MKRFLKNKLGLSLVELVVTITIMAILAAWLVPSLISTKQDSDMKMDKSSVENLESAIHIASQDSEVYMQAKMLADVSSNNQIKIIYAPNADGILECSTVSIKMGDSTLTSNDAAGLDLENLKMELVNRVNSTMDPVELKTADAKELNYCFIITFPDVKFKTNIEYYSSNSTDVIEHWEDIETEETIPPQDETLPDYTEPPVYIPPAPVKDPGAITKDPTAKTGLVYTGSAQELINPGAGTGTLYYSTTNAYSGFSSEIPTGTNTGTYTVWYYAEETSTHLQSATYQLTVKIDKASYNVVPPSAQAPVYDGNPHTLISAGSSKYGRMEYKIEGGSFGTALPAATNIGTYKIYYYGTGDANHHPTSQNAYIIAKISPKMTSTYAASNKTYTGSSQTGIVGENVTITGTTSATDAGIYTATVVPKTNYTWEDGTNVAITVTWEIKRATGTLSPVPTLKTLNYTGSAQQLINKPTTSTGTVYYKVNSGSWSTTVPTATNAGSYTIYYKMDPTKNYTGIEETLIGTLTIGKKTPTVTVPTAKTLTYTGNAQTLINAGSTNGGTLQYALSSTGPFSTTLPKGTNAGSYTVWYKVVGNANYNDVSAKSIPVTIKKATPSVTAPIGRTLTYNGNSQVLATTGSSSISGSFQYKLSTESTYKTTLPMGTNVGTYNINWKFVSNNTNYSDRTGNVTAKINIATPTVTAPTAKTLTYNGSAQALVNAGGVSMGGTMLYSLSENGTYSTSIPTGTNAGSYTVWYKVQATSNLNAPTPNKVNVTIAKATPSITLPKAKTGLTYNNAAQTLITAGSGSGTFKYKLSTASSYTTALPKGTAAQTYTINWTFTPTNTINYNSRSGSLTATIGGAPAVDKSYSFSYTGGVQTFTAPVTGYYNLEVWGAQGGNSISDGTAYAMGGKGGYSTGDVYLTAGQVLYIAIGGKGGNPTIGVDAVGGWNGGGNSVHDHSDDEVAGAGGGATSIVKDTLRGDGQLKNYNSYRNEVLIVAGGGGGGCWYTDAPGGMGGGLNGGTTAQNVSAATQSSGYSFGQGGSGYWNASWGANYASDGNGGGGGGWYGGYGSSNSDNYAGTNGIYNGGGGGSSYIDGVLNGQTVSGTQTGNGKAKITYRGTSQPSAPTTNNSPQTYNYTGSSQTFTAPVSGYYLLETWGAQGGSVYGTGGFGGYSKGQVYLTKGEVLYIYVGNQPSDTSGGYNGGGSGSTSDSASFYISGGGGASDIRKGGTALNNRIIVAGGGGGGADYSGAIIGGTGGGLTTGNVHYRDYGADVEVISGNIGATVSHGGAAPVDGQSYGGYNVAVTRGTLGSGATSGGGGYYGGPHYSCANRIYSGGGGSGYIGGVVNGVSIAGVQSGNGKVKVTYLSTSVNTTQKLNTKWSYGYTGGFQTFTAPTSGYYKLEAYGARGGANINGGDYSMLGYGGYTSGTTYLNAGQTIYIYVGQAGGYSTGSGESGGTPAPATFNGGGDGGAGMYTQGWHLGGAGGGATDFRLINGAWNNANGLASRILVAGGGGGQGCASSHNRGHGGGLTGVTTLNTGHYYNASSHGGTQKSAGSGNGCYWTDGVKHTSYASSGGFGYGGNAVQCAAGGGGGWYGGGTTYTSGGGGGSSFAAGWIGCSTAYSATQGGFVFGNVTMTQGVQNGNGAAYITYLG